MSESKNNHIPLLFLFYLVSHGGILTIPNALYWDDWVLYRGLPSAIIDTFIQQSGTLFYLEGYLHVAMLNIGPWVYKASTFALMFFSGYFLYFILLRHRSISNEMRFFIVLLFLVMPFNLARVALIDFRYTLCYFMFFFAWSLMGRYRILALILFFLSFNTNSLLVFYAVPFFDFFYRCERALSWRSFLNFCIRYIDYTLLPFIYFFIKIRYFAPSGIYEGYNEQYSMGNLAAAPVSQLLDLARLNISVVLGALFSIISFYIIKNNVPNSLPKERLPIVLCIVGPVILVFGAFPYWILGYVPTFGEWSSRHQLLLPLGVALSLVGLWYYLKGGLGIVCVFVGLSLAHNISAYKDFFVDWQKQKQLIQIFASSPAIKNGGLIVIDDKTINLNAIGRTYRFYEWNGILQAAFGDERRFAIPIESFSSYLAGEYRDAVFSSHYKAGGFKKDSTAPQVNVAINVVQPENTKEKILSKIFPQFKVTIERVNFSK
jgi:hypothetical protein